MFFAAYDPSVAELMTSGSPRKCSLQGTYMYCGDLKFYSTFIVNVCQKNDVALLTPCGFTHLDDCNLPQESEL